jgi:hypothetical protein
MRVCWGLWLCGCTEKLVDVLACEVFFEEEIDMVAEVLKGDGVI